MAALSVGLFVAWPGHAVAAVIYDNLNGRLYQGGMGAAIFTSPCNSCRQEAQDFDFAVDFTLTAISMPLAVFTGAPNSVAIKLYGSSNGRPGTVIESWRVDNAMIVSSVINPATTFSSEVTVTSALKPVLQKGQQYFVGFEWPFATQYIIYAPRTTVLENRTFALSSDQGATWPTVLSGLNVGYMAMRIEGDPVPPAVPEPASLLLVASGLLGVARRVRRAR